MRKYKFNLNEYIYVKIFDEGYRIMSDENNEILRHMPKYHKTPDDYKARADKDGYSKMQAHDFFSTFGKYLTLGFKTPFDINILFEHK